MSENRTVRAKKRSTSAPAKVEETMPGDKITFGISGEVNTRQGQKMWPRVGLESEHRVGETSDEASERVARYVIDSFVAFVDEVR